MTDFLINTLLFPSSLEVIQLEFIRGWLGLALILVKCDHLGLALFRVAQISVVRGSGAQMGAIIRPRSPGFGEIELWRIDTGISNHLKTDLPDIKQHE
jgi:hypothetical protein